MRSSGRSIGLCVVLFLAASPVGAQSAISDPQDLVRLTDNVFHLSEVMLRDGTNPPGAARFYAYSMLGAYMTVYTAEHQLPDITSRFRQDPKFKFLKKPRSFNLSFCSTYALLEVGKRIMPSGKMLGENQRNLVNEFGKNKKLSDREIAQNIRYAVEIANQVLDYAKTDGYGKLSTFTGYTPRKGEGYWYPTPPVYMAAVEPDWETIRPFFMESADQFSPMPPTSFSMDSTSAFYGQVMEVYRTVKELNDEQRLIANFWDCNPFAVSFSGHMAIGLKKISPGGHWMGITGISCRKAGVPLDSAIFIHTAVAMTLHDAFISCWQEKYKSNRIRPETVINRLIDPDWRPVLQTPPFPEYTSGHSAVSASAAVVLTHFFGDNFSFVDDTELYFGLPERRFNSFYEASEEAAISRLYGGIHYRDACEEGVIQGRKVGKYVVRSVFDVGSE